MVFIEVRRLRFAFIGGAPLTVTLGVNDKKEEPSHKDFACHGSEWPEHEDFLVGNKEGLIKLQEAISEALEKGESTIDAGEFVGVKCLDTAFFENQPNHVSKLSNIIGFAITIAVLFIFVVSLVRVFSWLVKSC